MTSESKGKDMFISHSKLDLISISKGYDMEKLQEYLKRNLIM